jgi:hypothetical protein
MVAVKGSKQFKMVVVRSRPGLKFAIASICLAVIALLVYGSHQQGMQEGLALKATIVEQRDLLQSQLDASKAEVIVMRQSIADKEVGEQIDTYANEEVRLTVESLQNNIAELREEVRFYKSVLMPNVNEKGLRIERLELKATADPLKVRYHLLLTQVVDKHRFIQGGVKMSLVGTRDNQEVSIPFEQLNGMSNSSTGFRFRYFQNIDGELVVPDGFSPMEIEVVATSTGPSGRRLERRFDWKLLEG